MYSSAIIESFKSDNDKLSPSLNTMLLKNQIFQRMIFLRFSEKFNFTKSWWAWEKTESIFGLMQQLVTRNFVTIKYIQKHFLFLLDAKQTDKFEVD